jgi:hypothetical protein
VSGQKKLKLLRQQPFIVAIVLGLAYGLCARAVFGLDILGDVFGVMTVAFIFGVPFGLGYLTISVAAPHRSLRWWHYILLPWVPSLLALLSALALAWEGLICIFLWVPLFMILSSLGGTCAGLLRLFSKSQGIHSYALGYWVLFPFILSPLEKQLKLPVEYRQVKTHIEIHSDPGTVWDNIKSVATIGEEEQAWAWFQLIGFPRPVAASLSYEGIGAIRHATFAGGIVFIETINRWTPKDTLTFAIKADPDTTPARTLDAHVTVGGPFFDVLEGEYRLERMAQERILLHLQSTYRLSTRFNIYAGVWTDFIMRDIQQYILKIIKKRCEKSQA